MDDKKKYNKALERARVYRDNARAVGDYAAVARYENIFPELRENEDEKIRKEIINFLETIPISELKRVPRPICQWFFWLEKQKEQKPAWSEEDTDMLNCCISSIEEAKENRYAYKETDGDTSYDREIDWLKSLRLSWKPSEEQMKGLKFFLDFHRQQRNAGTTNWREYDTVESLYEQLKKLM